MGLFSANKAKTATQLLGDDEFIFLWKRCRSFQRRINLPKDPKQWCWYGMVWYGKLANVLFYAKVIGFLLGFFSGLLSDVSF